MAASIGNEFFLAGNATTQTSTGGNKPLHRFLRGEPKCVGIAMMFMGSSLFMFGIPLKLDIIVDSSADIYSSFWLGILYFTCGVLYVLAEREPTKKIITASLALSILSMLGSVVAAINFIVALASNTEYYHRHFMTEEEEVSASQHYMMIYSLEAVHLFNCLLGAVVLITMTVFARLALRSSRTQTVVIMRNLPASE